MCGLTVSLLGQSLGDRSSNLIEYTGLLWWMLEKQIPSPALAAWESGFAKIVESQTYTFPTSLFSFFL